VTNCLQFMRVHHKTKPHLLKFLPESFKCSLHSRTHSKILFLILWSGISWWTQSLGCQSLRTCKPLSSHALLWLSFSLSLSFSTS
jgi:hypothetical protein